MCTRPVGVNGLGLSVEAAGRHVDQMERFFSILPDLMPAFTLWRKLLVQHAVLGVKVHDARLVAVMKAWDIRRIVTFNVSDFTRYTDIEPLHPEDAAKETM